MKFDAETAAPMFAGMDSNDLIRIAFLDETYVSEAKELAKRELSKRGLADVSVETIEQVRKEFDARQAAKDEHDLRSLETEEGMRPWRISIRSRLAPYRRSLSIASIALIGFCWLNSLVPWRLFALEARQWDGLGILFGLLWLMFVAPTRREFLNHRKSKQR
jgi:hypothetical protein